MSSFKSSENIQKKEGGPDKSVSDRQSSSVIPNNLAMIAKKLGKDQWLICLVLSIYKDVRSRERVDDEYSKEFGSVLSSLLFIIMYVGHPINRGNYSAFCKPYTLA